MSDENNDRFPLMKCGCSGQALLSKNGEPSKRGCGLHWCTELADKDEFNLEKRTAHCSYGKHAPKPSSSDLPFFQHHPEKEFDEYYCGCYGWD